MPISQTLRRARSAFVSKRLRARCTIVLVDPTREITDMDTGEVTPYRETLYTDVPCYVRYPGVAFESNHPVGGIQLVDSRILVRIPHDYRTETGDWMPYMIPVKAVIVWESDPDNPKLVGTEYLVKSLDEQSQASALRVLCEDAQSGVVV